MNFKSTKRERSSEILFNDGYNVPAQIEKFRIKDLVKRTKIGIQRPKSCL